MLYVETGLEKQAPLRRSSRWVTWLVIGLLLAFAIITGGIYWYGVTLLSPVAVAPVPDVVVNIPPGASTGRVAGILLENQLIRDSRAFVLYARYTGLEKQLKAGEFALNASQGIPDIIKHLVSGQQVTYPFTIPEGLTLVQIAELLAARDLVDRDVFLQVAAETDWNFPFLQDAPQGLNRLEGYLFPDTYRIPRGYTEKQIIGMMLKRFEQVMASFGDRPSQLGMTIHQVVTLASIIEREAKLAKEKPIVSAVFHNRLQKKMRLESCATVQYILGEPKAVLTYKDLEIQSPYNTYRNTGLPPGPIAAPGRGSLEAALYPADVDYLFFVVKPDGSHAFSRTLAEHNKNKRLYLP